MRTILTIGSHSFAMPSTSIARAIEEALKEAPQVRPEWHDNDIRFIPEMAWKRITKFDTCLMEDARVIDSEPAAPSPAVRALLDVSPKEARETRLTLAKSPAARRPSLAQTIR